MPADWLIREAGPENTQALFSLLPELLSASVMPSRCWLALDGEEHHRIVAAGAFEPSLQWPEQPGFRAQIRVLPAWRRRGVGRALVTRLVDDARAWSIDHLHTWNAARSAGEEGFLHALGCTPNRPEHHFVGELVTGLAVCEQRVSLLHKRGRVPPRFAVTPLAQVPLEAVTALYYRHFGGPVASARQHIQARLASEPCRSLSTAAWDGEQLAGFLLTDSATGVPRADLWISDPRWRHGWAAAMTLHATIRQCAAMGATHYRFHCNETARATINFARHSCARLEATWHHWTLPLGSQAQP